MKKIIPLKPQEEKIVADIKLFLQKNEKSKELNILLNNEEALQDLALAISKYPSIFGTQSLGRESRSVDTLVDNLQFHDVMDLLLHVPTKALLGKSFSIAKINFFYMIYYITQEHVQVDSLLDLIMDAISSSVFTIMAEEVFLAILLDRKIAKHIKNNAGYLLVNIWEYRIDHGVTEFAPVLNKIWQTRKELKPAYGTMLGISELLRMAENNSTIWMNYLQHDELSDDEVSALMEFLLGLTYEEMKMLRNNMERTGKSCLDENEMDIILGERKIYPEYRYDDPRELFKSYRHRHKNASFRFRAGLEGPKKTLEEYIMCYLLSRPDEWSDEIINGISSTPKQ